MQPIDQSSSPLLPTEVGIRS